MAVTLLFALGACGPRETALAYHQALARADGRKALGLVTADTRRALERRARHASTFSGGALPDDAAEMIVQGDRSAAPLAGPARGAARLEIATRTGTRAEVRLWEGARSWDMVLVREGWSWRVALDLPPEDVPGGR